MTTLSAPLVETPPRQLQYGDIRDRVEDGDIVLFRGTIFSSRVIETVSHGAYSHCAIAANWAERKMLLQAELTGGVQAVPLSVAAGTYKGRVDWYKIAPERRGTLDIPALLNVERCFRAAGMPLCKDSDVGTSPSEIATSGVLQYQGTIAHDPDIVPDRSI